jgi:hypothetical protein
MFMDFFELFRYFLILIVPGLVGALAYSIVSCLRTEIGVLTALIIDFFTFIIMLAGLFLFHGVAYIETLLWEFTCLSFTIKYALLSLLIAIILGVIGGIIRRLFFWIRR